MIILRQKEFSFGGFDWAFDSDGKLRTDLTDEDKRKFEAMKKKYPDEWKAFERKQKRGPRHERPYGYGGYGDHSSSKNTDELRKYERSNNIASGISWGSWGASIGNAAIRKSIKDKRRENIDEKIGHDKRMKRSERAEINKYKTKSDKSKKHLQDIIDDTKSEEEKKKAAKKYTKREVLDKASDWAINSGSIGTGIGHTVGTLSQLNKWATGRLTTKDRSSLKGTLIGLGAGATSGAIIGGVKAKKQAKKTIEKLKKSENRQKEHDRLEVARGRMTESEFVEKYGGKE